MTKCDMLKDKEIKTLLSSLCERDYTAQWARKALEQFRNVYSNLLLSKSDFELFLERGTLSDD